MSNILIIKHGSLGDLIQANGAIKDIKILKKYIVINKKEYNASSNFSYKTDQWLASEGSSEGIAELWLDRYYDPQNINKMNFDDLSLQAWG